MTLWRCPHCATPQPEASRCWVCKRSSTSCATCRNFRQSVALQIGYCGLDRRRLPLLGDEVRPCWQPAEVTAEPDEAVAAARAPAVARSFDFVELDEAAPVTVGAAPGAATLWGNLTADT